MIVISGVLVLVALVLLVVGVVGPDLAFVYASIAVSLVSLLFLVGGILQRRGEPETADEDADAAQPVTVDEPAEGITLRPSSLRRTPVAQEDDDAALQEDQAPLADSVDEVPVAEAVEEAPVADTVEEAPVAGGDVLVVEGRPRYHVPGCRYLSGKTPVAVEVGQARAEGFTPCGVCKPDAALAAPAQEEVVTRTAATRTAAAPVTAPVMAPVAPARSASPRGGSVVVIPDRGRYHREQCRYVRDVAGAEVLSKSAATRQGYAPCGVCKP